MSICGVPVSARHCAKHFTYNNSSSQCPYNRDSLAIPPSTMNEGLVVQCLCLRSLGPSEILHCLQEVYAGISEVEQRMKASEPNYFITHFLNCV